MFRILFSLLTPCSVFYSFSHISYTNFKISFKEYPFLFRDFWIKKTSNPFAGWTNFRNSGEIITISWFSTQLIFLLNHYIHEAFVWWFGTHIITISSLGGHYDIYAFRISYTKFGRVLLSDGTCLNYELTSYANILDNPIF